MKIPGLGGWLERIDGEDVTVIEYKDVRVYVRDPDSVTRILQQHTDLQIATGQRDSKGRWPVPHNLDVGA